MNRTTKLLTGMVIIIIVIVSIMGFLYLSISWSDSAWVFGQPEMTINQTVTNNITYDIVVGFNDWHEYEHSQYAIDKLIISIIVRNEDHSYGNYSYRDKLSTIENNNQPVTFIDHDNDGFLSIGDEFISDPSMIDDDFDYLYYNLLITVDGQTDVISIWKE